LHPSFYYRYDRLFVLSTLSDFRYLRERRRIEAERLKTLRAMAEAAGDQPEDTVPTPLRVASGR
jgi:hypothetical protein